MTGRRTAALLVAAPLVAALVAGCGSDGAGGSAAAPSSEAGVATTSLAPPAPLTPGAPLPATTGGRALDSGALTAALLPASLLPDGFAQDADPSDPGTAGPTTAAPAPSSTAGASPGDGSTSVVGQTTPAACARVLDPVVGLVPGATGSADRGFTGSDAFTSVTQDVASWDGTGALAALGSVRDTAAGCASFTSTDADGIPGSYTLGTVDGLDPADLLGADALTALRVVGTTQGVSAVFDVVVAVVGRVVVQVVVVGLTPLPTDQLRGIVAGATDRVRAAQA